LTRDRSEEHQHTHPRGHREHDHTHGAVDPTIATSERGIWAIKWSFVGLMATALLQLVVVLMSGSVALLSDTIHNFGDAATAVPLGIAFALTRLGVSRRFTFGYGRVEDWPGCSSC
jgi:divalent metal cation (Fe/Co/Zn/Cd) transporter